IAVDATLSRRVGRRSTHAGLRALASRALVVLDGAESDIFALDDLTSRCHRIAGRGRMRRNFGVLVNIVSAPQPGRTVLLPPSALVCRYTDPWDELRYAPLIRTVALAQGLTQQPLLGDDLDLEHDASDQDVAEPDAEPAQQHRADQHPEHPGSPWPMDLSHKPSSVKGSMHAITGMRRAAGYVVGE